MAKFGIVPSQTAQDRRRGDAHIAGHYVLVYADSRGYMTARRGLRAAGRGKAKAAPRRGVQKARPLPNLTPSPLNVVNVHRSVFKAHPDAGSHVLRPEIGGGTISAWRAIGTLGWRPPLCAKVSAGLDLRHRSGTIGHPRAAAARNGLVDLDLFASANFLELRQCEVQYAPTRRS
jgi:hypothetical protein